MLNARALEQVDVAASVCARLLLLLLLPSSWLKGLREPLDVVAAARHVHKRRALAEGGGRHAFNDKSEFIIFINHYIECKVQKELVRYMSYKIL